MLCKAFVPEVGRAGAEMLFGHTSSPQPGWHSLHPRRGWPFASLSLSRAVLGHKYPTLYEQEVEACHKSLFKQMTGLRAGVGKRKGTSSGRSGDTCAVNFQRACGREMMMGAETLQNPSGEVNSAWAEISELYFGS